MPLHLRSVVSQDGGTMCMVSHKQILEVLGDRQNDITFHINLYSVDISVSINPYGLSRPSLGILPLCVCLVGFKKFKTDTLYASRLQYLMVQGVAKADNS